MTFAEVQELYRIVRQRVVVHAGESAFPSINVALPMRVDDELSFLRLVVWSYVLLQENGRIAFRLLGELSGHQLGPLLDDVACLRTWTAHNLSLTKDNDKAKVKRAWAWFRTRCGRTSALETAHWALCFEHLSGSVGEMLRDALDASEVLDHPIDGLRNVEELRRRVDRDWEAYRFDNFLTEAASRLGFDSIDALAFRKRKLDSWRKVVAAAQDGAIERLLTQRIEADLLELLGSSLPMTALEILARVPLNDPVELAVLMLTIRSRTPLSHRDLGGLLQDLAAKLSAPTGESS